MLPQRWSGIIYQGENINGCPSRLQRQRLCYLAVRKVRHYFESSEQSVFFQELLLHDIELLREGDEETDFGELSVCVELMEREGEKRDNAVEVDKESLQLAQSDVRMDWGESIRAFLQANNHIFHITEHDPHTDENPLPALGLNIKTAIQQTNVRHLIPRHLRQEHLLLKEHKIIIKTRIRRFKQKLSPTKPTRVFNLYQHAGVEA